jgi:capsular exopolysaccharide synthesis family protein
VAGLLLGGLLASLTVLMSEPVYQTHVRFFISTSATGDTASAAYEGNLFSQQRITSYAELIADQQVASAVIDDLNLDLTTDQLASRLAVVVIPNTVIMDVTVSDPSAPRAVAIARAIQGEFNRVVTALETPPGGVTSSVTVHVITDPQLPSAPSSPRPVRDITVGMVLGLLVAGAALLLRARLDTRVRDPEHAALELGAPALGVVLQDRALKDEHVLSPESMTPTAEGLRQVGTNLTFLDMAEQPRLVAVTSSMPGEGKTTVATNLAVQLAEEGRRVVLVEADLRHPQLAETLGLTGEAGLSQVLDGSVEPSSALQSYGETGRLRVVVAGPPVTHPGTLLGSPRMRAWLEKLLEDTDLVILDTAPLLSVADTSRLLPLLDGAVVCARWGVVTAKELAQARGALERVGATALGVVVTFVPRSAAPAVGHGAAYRRDEPSTWATADPRRRGWRRRLRSGTADAANPVSAQEAPSDRPLEDASTGDGAPPSAPLEATDQRPAGPTPLAAGADPGSDDK